MIKHSEYEFLSREFYMDVGEIKLIELDHPQPAFNEDNKITRSFNDVRFFNLTKQEVNSLEEAILINMDIAYECTKWGKYEAQGFRYIDYGFKSVYELIDELKQSEFSQLLLYLIYLENLNKH